MEVKFTTTKISGERYHTDSFLSLEWHGPRKKDVYSPKEKLKRSPLFFSSLRSLCHKDFSCTGSLHQCQTWWSEPRKKKKKTRWSKVNNWVRASPSANLDSEFCLCLQREKDHVHNLEKDEYWNLDYEGSWNWLFLHGLIQEYRCFLFLILQIINESPSWPAYCFTHDKIEPK